MTGTDDLVPVLKRLKLGPVLHTLDLRLEQAAKENLDPLEFLFRVLHDEVERRDSKNLQDRLERAGFEHDKTLEGFNWQFNPQIQKSRIIDSRDLSVRRKEGEHPLHRTCRRREVAPRPGARAPRRPARLRRALPHGRSIVRAPPRRPR